MCIIYRVGTYQFIQHYLGLQDINPNYENIEHCNSGDLTLNERMDVEIDDQLSEFDQYLRQYQFSTDNNPWSAVQDLNAGENMNSFDFQQDQTNRRESNNDCVYYPKLDHKFNPGHQYYDHGKEFAHRYDDHQLLSPVAQHTHGGHAHHHHQWPNNQAQYFTTYQEYLPCRDSEKTYACSNI